jgi:hypothetical protein
MGHLRSADPVELSWRDGTVACRVVAVAGAFVLLRPDRAAAVPEGDCSLIFLDGKVPMGWDGVVHAASHPSELCFRVSGDDSVADRRVAVRVPVSVPVDVTLLDGSDEEGVPVLGEAIDVSAGGMRLRRRGRVPRGAEVHVLSRLPRGLLIDAEAVVRASEPGICSVEYTHMRAATSADVGAWTVDTLRSTLVTAA